MLTKVAEKRFANGVVYALRTEDGYLIETTDTWLPYYTKDAIGRKQNFLDNNDLGSRADRWMIGVSTMSGCCVGCAFCFEKGTMVTMADFSRKPIEEVQVGDKVIGVRLMNKKTPNSQSQDYATRYLVPTEVTNTFIRNYNDEFVILTTESGGKITATKTHPIACTKNNDTQKSRIKFFDAEKIEVGDFVYTTKSKKETNNIWRLGWLYGFCKGDGIQTKAHKRNCEILSLSQSYLNVMEFARDICDEFKINHAGLNVNHIKKEGYLTNYRMVINSTGIKTLFELVDKYCNKEDFLRGALAGFWDAEGFSLKNNRSARMCGCDKEELIKFGEIVKKFGGEYKIKLYGSNKDRGDNMHDCYILETNISRLDFVCDFNPIHPKANFFEEYKHQLKGIKKEKIIAVEKRKTKTQVYNFETNSHTYIANDIVVHNCATGNMKKFRNLTADEIVEQVEFILSQNKQDPLQSKEFKINYTRMGEPFLNIKNVREAINRLDKYNPHHYVSTIGVSGSDFSWIKDNITLQISLHSLDDERRNNLIPFKKKMTIKELGQIRTKSNLKTTVNMTLVDTADFNIEKLKQYFDPQHFFIKLSPINENCVSKKNHMGKGVIEGVNIV